MDGHILIWAGTLVSREKAGKEAEKDGMGS